MQKIINFENQSGIYAPEEYYFVLCFVTGIEKKKNQQMELWNPSEIFIRSNSTSSYGLFLYINNKIM